MLPFFLHCIPFQYSNEFIAPMLFSRQKAQKMHAWSNFCPQSNNLYPYCSSDWVFSGLNATVAPIFFQIYLSKLPVEKIKPFKWERDNFWVTFGIWNNKGSSAHCCLYSCHFSNKKGLIGTVKSRQLLNVMFYFIHCWIFHNIFWKWSIIL